MVKCLDCARVRRKIVIVEKPPFIDDITLPASVKRMNFDEVYSDNYECHGHAHDLDEKDAWKKTHNPETEAFTFDVENERDCSNFTIRR
jgi:hypothetical protein